MTSLWRHADAINCGKILRDFSKNSLFELNFHPEAENELNSLLSKFNELSENYPKFLILSLLDQEIRKKRLKIIKEKIGKLKMSRTTKIGRPSKCCYKVKSYIRLGEKFWQSYFGAVMTSSKSRKTAKNQKKS